MWISATMFAYIDLKFVSLQVHEVKSDLSQIGFDVEMIQQMVSGLVS